jgi:hypothetical protein
MTRWRPAISFFAKPNAVESEMLGTAGSRARFPWGHHYDAGAPASGCA